jgi:hypothetical protein
MGCDESALLRVNSGSFVRCLSPGVGAVREGRARLLQFSVSPSSDESEDEIVGGKRDRLWNSRTEDEGMIGAISPMPVMTQVALVVVPLRGGLSHATPHRPSPSGVSGNDTERKKKTQKLKLPSQGLKELHLSSPHRGGGSETIRTVGK